MEDFKDPKTGLCKAFVPKHSKKLIINTEDPVMFNFYSMHSCSKGNKYVDYCDYCAKELCLYYKPTVQIAPEGKGGIIILDN